MIVKNPKIKVILNGTVITDGDITEARKNGTLDHREHPGLKRDSGHIGFLGHGFIVRFRNIRVKDSSFAFMCSIPIFKPSDAMLFFAAIEKRWRWLQCFYCLRWKADGFLLTNINISQR